jgi:hypothetical protein
MNDPRTKAGQMGQGSGQYDKSGQTPSSDSSSYQGGTDRGQQDLNTTSSGSDGGSMSDSTTPKR